MTTSATDTCRWAGVGTSDALDSWEAGVTAASTAIAHREDTKLIVVFCSERHDMGRLLEAINGTSGHAPLIGCSTSGEIATSGPGDGGVVVFAMGGSGFHVRTHLVDRIDGEVREAGVHLARALSDAGTSGNEFLLLLTDALAGDQQEILRGVYSILGAQVPLVGGCAGDDLRMDATFQFHGSTVATDAIVGALVGSDGPIGIGVHHCWETVGQPMLVTRSIENHIFELDGRPALDVYLERLDAPDSVRAGSADFPTFAVKHPLGVARRTGEPHARFISGANFAERSLICIASVNEGSSVWLMEGDETSVLAATTAACDEALDSLQGHEPIGMLAFDCIARRDVLGPGGIATEIECLASRLGGAPVAGFYTYGEIARTNGISGFHNETLVVLAIS